MYICILIKLSLRELIFAFNTFLYVAVSVTDCSDIVNDFVETV